MLLALNQLLGRSMVDSSVKDAYQMQQTEPLLVDCGFEPAMARRLAEVEASSLEAYLMAVYELVTAELERQDSPSHPWPGEGLAGRSDGRSRARDEAA